MPDKGIPEEVLAHAKCVAVLPHIAKGGFIFGAKGGTGVAICRTANGWSAPAFITISGGSWVLQIGVEAVDVVMTIRSFRRKRGCKDCSRAISKLEGTLQRRRVQLDGMPRPARIGNWIQRSSPTPVPRVRSQSSGWKVHRSAKTAIPGTRCMVITRALLLGKVPAPAAAQPFLAEIRGAKAQAVALGDARGWRAAAPGSQTIRLVFDQPQRLRYISFVFEENETIRAQEFVLRWSPGGWSSVKENCATAVEFEST